MPEPVTYEYVLCDVRGRVQAVTHSYFLASSRGLPQRDARTLARGVRLPSDTRVLLAVGSR